jgi:hypothetical protein
MYKLYYPRVELELLEFEDYLYEPIQLLFNRTHIKFTYPPVLRVLDRGITMSSPQLNFGSSLSLTHV